MITDKGVYTTKCPTCTRSVLMHVLADESISPKKCTHCKVEFAGLEHGKERNTFDIVPAVKKLSIFGNEKAEEKAEEKNQTAEKEHKVPLKITRIDKGGNTKSKRESFKVTW